MALKLNESYDVGGFDISTSEVIDSKKFNDPGKAIEHWFKMNQKYPTCISINPSTEDDAKKCLQWAVDNESKLRSWDSKYKCPYKIDWLINKCKYQLENRKRLLAWSGDQLHPFDLA